MALAIPNRPLAIQLVSYTRQSKDTWHKLARRGIATTAQQHGWWAGDYHGQPGWWQPLYDAQGQILLNPQNGQPTLAFKNAQKGSAFHDAWHNYPKGSKFLMLPRHNLTMALAQAEGVLHLAEGKADTLSLWAAGLPNAAGLFGTSSLPTNLVSQFHTWKVRHVVYYAHHDANGSGFKVAYKLATLLEGSTITAQLLKLPQTPRGDKIDLNDLWIASEFICEQFLQHLAKLEPLQPPPGPLKPTIERPLTMPFMTDEWEAAKTEIKHRADCFEYMRLCSGEPKMRDSSGGKWLAPARPERTASFHVYKGDRGFWDFGNNSGGDIFTLDQLLHGGDFATSLIRLAAYYGVTLPARPMVVPVDASRPTATIDYSLETSSGELPTLPTAHAQVLERYAGRLGTLYQEAAQAIFAYTYQTGQTGSVPQIAAATGIAPSRLWRALRSGLQEAFQTRPQVDPSAPDELSYTNAPSSPIKRKDYISNSEERFIHEIKSTGSPKAAHRPAAAFAPDLSRLTFWLLREVVAPAIAERHGLPRATVNWLESLGYAGPQAEARAVRLAYVERLTPTQRAAYDKQVSAAARELLSIYRQLHQRPSFDQHISQEEHILSLSRAGQSKRSIARVVGCSVNTVGNVEHRHRLTRDRVQHWVEVTDASQIKGEWTRSGGYILTCRADSDGVITAALVEEPTVSRPMTEQEWMAYQAEREAQLTKLRQARAAQKTDPQAQYRSLQKALHQPQPTQEEVIRCGHHLTYSVRLLEQYERVLNLRPKVLDTTQRAAALVQHIIESMPPEEGNSAVSGVVEVVVSKNEPVRTTSHMMIQSGWTHVKEPGTAISIIHTPDPDEKPVPYSPWCSKCGKVHALGTCRG